MTHIAGLESGFGRERTQGAADAAARHVAEALFSLLIAACLTGIPILAHTVHPAVGLFSAVLFSGLCAWRMPQVSVTVVLFAMLFQNTFVSLAADLITTANEFNFIRGYNFVVLSVTWAVAVGRYLVDYRYRNPALDPFIRVSLLLFFTIGVYFLVGVALYGMTAVVYLRNIITPMLLFHICMITFAQRPMRLTLQLTLMSLISVLCGYFEFFERETWLGITNGYSFWRLSGGENYSTLILDKMAAKTGIVSTGLLDSFSITLFNSSLLGDYGIRVLRLFGPNMHAISYAYALSFFAVFSLYRGRFVIAGLMLLLLVLTSTKGPLIIFLLVGVSWTVSRIFGMRFALLLHAGMLAVYAMAGILLGLRIGDYHVIGLIGGLDSFIRFPIGYGIGAGGNLSSEFINIDWEAAQAAGRTPFAVESAIGVLFYQMGVFAPVVIGTFAWIAWRVTLIAERTGNSLHAAAALGLGSVVVTGLFQEEAYFAPLAIGLFMALAGMIVGASARNGALR